VREASHEGTEKTGKGMKKDATTGDLTPPMLRVYYFSFDSHIKDVSTMLRNLNEKHN
jgi:hypothetical protein